MALPEIGLKAVLDNKAFNKAMSAYIRDVDKMVLHTDLASQGMGGGFLALGGAVTKFATLSVAAGAAVAAAVGGMIVALGVDSVKTAISFESAYAGVVKTVGGLTEDFGVLNEAGRELKEGFKDLSEEVPFTVEELMEIGKIGGQLGIAKEDLIDFTNTIAAMSVTTDLTTEAAALGFARFMAIMGTAAEDVERVGSSVVELGNTYATTEPEILNFSLRLAGIGKIAGLTEADVLGIGTAMSAVGVQSEAGGTAVQKVLIAMMTAAGASGDAFVDNSAAIAKNEGKLEDLQQKLAIAQQQQSEFTDKTKESTRMAKQFQIDNLIADIEALTASTAVLNETQGMLVTQDTLGVFAKTAGMSVAEFRQMWEEDAASAFTAFVQGLGEQGAGAITTLDAVGLADQRLMRSFLSLAGAGDKLGSTIASSRGAWDENIAMAWEAAQRYATTEAQMQMLRNVWRNTKDDIGTMLLPALGDMIVMFRGLIDQHGPALVALFEEHIVPAVEALVGAFGKLLEGDMAGVLSGVQEALGALVGPEVAQQIMDAANAVAEFVRQVSTFVSEHSEELKAAFIAIGAILVTAAIASTIASIAAAIAALANPIGLVIAAVALLAAAWVGDWGGIRTALTEFWLETAQPFFQSIGEWFSTKLPVLLANVRDWFVQAWEDIKTAVGVAWEFLVGVWEGIVVFFTRTIPDAAQKLWQSILEKNEAIQQTFSNVWNGILDFLKRIWDGIRVAVLAAIILLLQLIGTNLDELKAGWDFIWDGIKNHLAFVWASIESTVKTVSTAVKAFIGEALEWIQSTWETVWGAVSKIAGETWDAIYKAVSEAVEEVKAFVIETVEGLQERWDELWGLIKEVAETMISGLITALEGMAESLKSSILTPINDAKEEVVKKVSEWVQVGRDLINGVISGIGEVVGNLAKAVGDAVGGAVAEAKARLGIESPSKVFAEIGRNIVQGLINGILAGKGNLQSTIRGLVDIGRAFGAMGSGAAQMMQSRVMAPLEAAIEGIDGQLEALGQQREEYIGEAARIAKERADENIALIEAEIAARIAGVKEEGDLREAAIKAEMAAKKTEIQREFDDRELALKREFDDREDAIEAEYDQRRQAAKDSIEDEAQLAAYIASLDANELAAKRALEDEEREAKRALADEEAARIDALKQLELAAIAEAKDAEAAAISELKALEQERSDARLAALEREIEAIERANGMMDVHSWAAYHEEMNRLLAERARLTEEYAAAEAQVLEIERQQEQLAFLQQQMDLLDFIKERGLDAGDLLEGVELGINADLGKLLAAMSAAMQQVIDTAEAQFGIASPSKVFAKIGQNLMAGLGDSITRFSTAPSAAMEWVAQHVTAPARGMERVFAPAMIPSPVVRVQGGSQVTNHFDLNAHYRYQEERELMDDVRLMRLMAGA